MTALVQWDQIKGIEEYRNATDTAIAQAPTTPPSIAVLGAGISGLVASYELARKGYQVSLYEASNRIGGRILTNHFQGAHAELGAMRIPGPHIGTRAYATSLLELAREDFLNASKNGLFHLRGKTLPMADTQSLAQLFELNERQSEDIDKNLHRLLTKPFVPLVMTLTQQEQNDIQYSRIAGSTERVQKLDAQSVRDFLFSDKDTDANAREFIASANYLKDVWSSPCTALIKEFLAGRDKGLEQLSLGMEALPLGMLDLINNTYPNQIKLQTNTTVRSIHNQEQGVTLTLRQGLEGQQDASTHQTFDYVLCTLPFGALRQIPIQGISFGKQAAIDRMRYANSTKVLLHFKEKFWEQLEKPIFGGSSVTDRIASQIYYPTNPQAQLSSSPATQSVEMGTAIFPSGGTHAPSLTMPRNSALRQPGVLIGSYAWGSNAERLGALSNEARLDVVLSCLRDLHGSVVDETFAGTGASMAWGQSPYSAGAFGQPDPRDLTVFRNDAKRREDHLYFCGEHLSSDPGWINGSINSTLYAITAMTEAISTT